MSERPTDRSGDDARISALLRGLPDPGPMPPAVADRIQAALRAERAERSGPGADNVTPLVSRSPGAPIEPVASNPSPQNASASSSALPDRRTNSNRWLRPVAGLAAAAAVAGIAAVAYDRSHQTAPPASAVSTTSSAVSAADIRDGVHVEQTGTNYTRSAMSTQAASLLHSGEGHSVSAQDERRLGTVATKDGALACAKSIGADLLNRPDRVTVDIADFESKPSLVVVISKDGESTAWAVSRTCQADTKPLAGPTHVDS